MTVWSDDIDLATADPMVFTLRAIAAQKATRRTSAITARVMTEAADEIVRLRARVTELEAENAAFREQFATADEVAALMAEHGGKLEDVPGWVKVHYPDWRALADQLAEALRADSVAFSCSCAWDQEGTPRCVANGTPCGPRYPSRTASALAAHEAARKEMP